MIVGVPKEIKVKEFRVGLAPEVVRVGECRAPGGCRDGWG